MRWDEGRNPDAALWGELDGCDAMKDLWRAEARSSLEEHAPFFTTGLAPLLYIIDRRIAKGTMNDPELESARAAIEIPDQYNTNG